MKTKKLCRALTLKGKRCKFRASYGDFCTTHGPMIAHNGGKYSDATLRQNKSFPSRIRVVEALATEK